MLASLVLHNEVPILNKSQLWTVDISNYCLGEIIFVLQTHPFRLGYYMVTINEITPNFSKYVFSWNMDSTREKKIHKHTERVQSKIRSSISISSYQQCVEELILNSLDSSANCIAVKLNVTNGFVQVVDNGSGIGYKSMRLLGERYKINCINQLLI